MVDRIVAHRIVESDFHIRIDSAHRNDVMAAPGIHSNSAVGVTRMIELAGETRMKNILMLGDL